MSNTLHHRKPGAPRKGRKGYIPDRHRAEIRAAVLNGDTEGLATFEPIHVRRTR